MAAVGLSARCPGARGGISILSRLLHPLPASSWCLPDFSLRPRLGFDRYFVVQEKLEVGVLGRLILLQQNPECSSSRGIRRVEDASEKEHLSQDQRPGREGCSSPAETLPPSSGCMSGRCGRRGRAPTGTGHTLAQHSQPSQQSTDTFCRLSVLLHIYQPDLHGSLHKLPGWLL